MFWLNFTEKIKTSHFLVQLVIWLPVVILYAIPLYLQEDIGTDYHTYYNYFFNDDYLLYFRKGELIFYYIVLLTRYLGHPQILFVIIGTIQLLLFFYTLHLLKKRGYKSWLLFFLFVVVTTIYNNQMNGLRQFVVVNGMLLFAIFLSERRFFKSFILSVLGLLFHKTSFIATGFIFILKKYLPYSGRKIFFIFIISSFLFSVNYLDSIEALFSNSYWSSYLHYLNSESESVFKLDIASIIGKLYFVPILLYFYFVVFKSKKKLSNFEILSSKVVACTYFLFLQAGYFHIFLRLWQYFNIFMIIPIYLVINWAIQKKQFNLVFFLLLYLSLPYLYKIIFVAEREYSFNLIFF
ncbi:EpsG family protein [Tenacibaculum piscium]|uniref:EpsG family protein n=1 Tax=Tenacibaculum piscium TaxID=1458515 RepID=UPI001EFB03C6|nr:EpsG family protein [Tenacibaculum piscium]MCG8183411.1 EpsG family protein [Tenacibaculum piscium]MCG8205102.1 EpsG family protein [Tenacibaculum piscium]